MTPGNRSEGAEKHQSKSMMQLGTIGGSEGQILLGTSGELGRLDLRNAPLRSGVFILTLSLLGRGSSLSVNPPALPDGT